MNSFVTRFEFNQLRQFSENNSLNESAGSCRVHLHKSSTQCKQHEGYKLIENVQWDTIEYRM